MEQRQVSGPYQLDHRWIGQYRDLVSYDSYWWLTWTGPFTAEEQRQWDRLGAQPLNASIKAQLGELMKASRERELATVLAEQREPRLQYPALPLEEIRRRIAAQRALAADIRQEEPHAIVRRFYQGAIEEELDYLSLIEATSIGDATRFWECGQRLFPLPTPAEMASVLAPVKRLLRQGLENPHAWEIARQFQEFCHIHLQLSVDGASSEEGIAEEQPQAHAPSSHAQQYISAPAAKRFFQTVLQEGGCERWQVALDPNATNARVEQGARILFLVEKTFALAEIRHLLIHELIGHIAPCVAGEHSSLGLLGIHTQNSASINEGVALYHECQVLAASGQVFDDQGLRTGTLLVGLASGVVTPPQTFRSLATFLERLTMLTYLTRYPAMERQKAQKLAQSYALSLCLRIYRGVPDLEQAGVCYPQDVIYWRGLRLVEQAVAEDETVLDRLAVGVCALEDLPDLQELGIISAPHFLRNLVYAKDLDAYILSFEAQSVDL